MAKVQVLIAGVSASGKSMSLENLAKDNPKSVAYLSCEAGKSTPFPHQFITMRDANGNEVGIKHPDEAVQFFKQVETMDSIEYCVLDGFNYLCDMYESMVVKTATNTQQAWGLYGDFIRNFMQQVMGTSTKKWILIAHNAVELTPAGDYRYYVPVKGAMAKTGIESFFNVVVYAQRMKVDKLKEFEYDPELLHFSARDERLGYKHVFQVQPTKDMAEGRIRDLAGMWNDNQIYMDNDAQLLLNHISNYFGETK
jgi:gp44|nr:MAG TPA: AAA domain protein [Caudoviricetes sp.]